MCSRQIICGFGVGLFETLSHGLYSVQNGLSGILRAGTVKHKQKKGIVTKVIKHHCNTKGLNHLVLDTMNQSIQYLLYILRCNLVIQRLFGAAVSLVNKKVYNLIIVFVYCSFRDLEDAYLKI